MKVFKIVNQKFEYCYAAITEEEALNKFVLDGMNEYEAITEIPETEWDKKSINVFEDNDFEKKPFKISIRESMSGTYPQLLYTNDISLIF